MKLIPANATEEIHEAAKLAEDLKRTAEATIAGSFPLIPDAPDGRPLGEDQIGLPASITDEKSTADQLEDARSEIAELRAAQNEQPSQPPATESVSERLAAAEKQLAELRSQQAQPGREINLAIGGAPPDAA